MIEDDNGLIHIVIHVPIGFTAEYESVSLIQILISIFEDRSGKLASFSLANCMYRLPASSLAENAPSTAQSPLIAADCKCSGDAGLRKPKTTLSISLVNAVIIINSKAAT